MQDTTKALLIADFEQSTAMVLECLEQTPETVFLKKPAPEKWNISEIMEHVIISDKSSMIAMLRDGGLPDAATTQASETKIQTMLSYNGNGWIAPEAATPKGIFTQLAEAKEAFSKTRNRILQFAKDNDLDHLGAGFEHPRLGKLTRAQWIQFLSWHARHHYQQMAGILDRERQAN